MIKCHLGETSNQQIYNKSRQLLLGILFLYFIGFSFKLHNAAQFNIISSTCRIIVTGLVSVKILKNFILSVVLSTWIRKFVTYFCLLNLRLCHLAFNSCSRWNKQSAKMKMQFFLNLKISVCQYFTISF